MTHTSAHREMQEAVQAASDASRAQTLEEVREFFAEHVSSPLTIVELVRAFEERFFGQEGAQE